MLFRDELPLLGHETFEAIEDIALMPHPQFCLVDAGLHADRSSRRRGLRADWISDRLPTETGLPGWACEIRTQKCRRKLSL